MRSTETIRLFYSSEYVAAAHAFDTTRKAGWVAESLQREPIPGIELVAPTALSEESLRRVHDPGYVRAVRDGAPRGLAESQGFAWDPALWRATTASSGGVVAAVHEAANGRTAGSLSSGLHHARRDSGNGYCTFNGLALGALEALERTATPVLVLDLDAHCGGGTYSIIVETERAWQTDISVSDYDAYQPSARCSLDIVRHASEYLPRIRARLAEHDAAGRRFSLCLYNAGMDPFEGSAEDGLAGITKTILAEREREVFAWSRRRGTPLAFVLAGGYVSSALSPADLVALHRLTLSAAVNA